MTRFDSISSAKSILCPRYSLIIMSPSIMAGGSSLLHLTDDRAIYPKLIDA